MERNQSRSAAWGQTGFGEPMQQGFLHALAHRGTQNWAGADEGRSRVSGSAASGIHQPLLPTGEAGSQPPWELTQSQEQVQTSSCPAPRAGRGSIPAPAHTAQVLRDTFAPLCSVLSEGEIVNKGNPVTLSFSSLSVPLTHASTSPLSCHGQVRDGVCS